MFYGTVQLTKPFHIQQSESHTFKAIRDTTQVSKLYSMEVMSLQSAFVFILVLGLAMCSSEVFFF